MDLKITKAFKQAAGLGLVAGMRTSFAPAVLSHMYSRHPSQNLDGSPLAFAQSITTSKVFKVMAVGEIIGDKLPTAPNRTDLPGLTGRVVSGIFAGVAVYKANGKNVLIGGIIGGSAALASTFGCFFLRTGIARKSIVPDAIVGACEDVLAIAIGVKVAQM